MTINPIIKAAIDRMHMRPVAIAPAYATHMQSDLTLMALADPSKEQASVEQRHREILAGYGMLADDWRNEKPFCFTQGVAIVPVTGMLINRFGASWGSYVTGYNYIRAMMTAAMDDRDVKAIVLDVNSYGGQVAGCLELAADIRAMCGKGKPIVAIVDSNCYSAAYAITSAADKVIVTPSGGAGSIGVLQIHMSYQGMFENDGVKVTLIHSGDHKVDGNPYNDLPDDVQADMQTECDVSRQEFAELVATHRGLEVQAVLDTEARRYRAEDALAAGLIDEIASPTEAMSQLLGELSQSSKTQLERFMTLEATGAAEQQATQNQPTVAAAKAEERQRIAAIIGLPEAQDKSKMANHLALNTEMSVDDAKALLAVAAPEVQPKADAQDANNVFADAMNKTDNPNVGAEAHGGNEQQGESFLMRAAKAKAGIK